MPTYCIRIINRTKTRPPCSYASIKQTHSLLVAMLRSNKNTASEQLRFHPKNNICNKYSYIIDKITEHVSKL